MDFKYAKCNTEEKIFLNRAIRIVFVARLKNIIFLKIYVSKNKQFKHYFLSK